MKIDEVVLPNSADIDGGDFQTPAGKPQKRGQKRKQSQTLFLIGILAIPVLNWLIFWLYVNISSFTLAFQNARGEWSFVNFTKFWDELTSPYGSTIGRAMINTFKYFGVNVLIIFPLSVIISYFLYKKILGYNFFRIVFFFPAIISGVALTTVFSNMISPMGPLGAILEMIGVTMPAEGYLMNKDTATTTIMIYTVWTGFTSNVILACAAMNRIPVEVLESAKLEGCSNFKEIIFLIIPLIWSSLSTVIIMLLTSILSSGGPILLFHPDGGYDTTTLSFWIFKQVYGSGQAGGTGNYGLVSCAGLIFTFVSMPIIIGTRKLIEKVPAVEY